LIYIFGISINILNMSLQIFDSLEKRKKEFIPLIKNNVSIYSCGLTPNKTPHIGHAIAAIRSNIIRNYLTYLGFKVTYCQNITDVDDKIIIEAKKNDCHPNDIVSKNLKVYEMSLESLDIKIPDESPKVSKYIDNIILYIKELIKSNYAYTTNKGDVYFSVARYKDYGKLNKMNLDDLMEGVRVSLENLKEHSADFALWKRDHFPGASWDSPWGIGRPGWHIECSVMANAIFGPSIDIHCGGRDLKFPHHENEIAQCEAHNNGTKFANNWCHFGLMRMDGEKMSKSIGNIVSIDEAVDSVSSELLIYSLMTVHYRSDINWGEKLFLENTNKILDYYRTFEKINSKEHSDEDFSSNYQSVKNLELEFEEAMNNDFSTHSALVIFMEYFREIKSLLMKTEFSEASQLSRKLITLGEVLGIFQKNLKEVEQGVYNYVASLNKLDVSFSDFKMELEQRPILRQNKKFEELDDMRTLFEAKNILINDDSPYQSSWSVKVI